MAIFADTECLALLCLVIADGLSNALDDTVNRRKDWIVTQRKRRRSLFVRTAPGIIPSQMDLSPDGNEQNSKVHIDTPVPVNMSLDDGSEYFHPPGRRLRRRSTQRSRRYRKRPGVPHEGGMNKETLRSYQLSIMKKHEKKRERVEVLRGATDSENIFEQDEYEKTKATNTVWKGSVSRSRLIHNSDLESISTDANLLVDEDVFFLKAMVFSASLPTTVPTSFPSRSRTEYPTPTGTSEPTQFKPTDQPSPIPSDEAPSPTIQPTKTSEPTTMATLQPNVDTASPIPSFRGTNEPTHVPFEESFLPTPPSDMMPAPTVQPTGRNQPTMIPTLQSSTDTTLPTPTSIPTSEPTFIPTNEPTRSPSGGTFPSTPSINETPLPTVQPVGDNQPSCLPTMQSSTDTALPTPTLVPTNEPTYIPSGQTFLPTLRPDEAPFPTVQPVGNIQPTSTPAAQPNIDTDLPTFHRTISPSFFPSEQTILPTNLHSSLVPSAAPSNISINAPPSLEPSTQMAVTVPPSLGGTVALTQSPSVFSFSAIPTRMPSGNSAPPTEPCGVSPTIRSFQIRSKLIPVSGLPLLTDPTTPQFAASQWLIDSDDRLLCPEDPNLVQRYVLAVLYYSTEGYGWTNCSAIENAATSPCMMGGDGETDGEVRYLSANSECDWFGSQCRPASLTPEAPPDDEDGVEDHTNSSVYNAIAEIDLPGNMLVGPLPIELSSLLKLRGLGLANNILRGTIPMAFGDLIELRKLDIGKNMLTGALPTELYGLSRLTVLDVISNQLEGMISSDIGQLRRLRKLKLQGNRFNGSIPSQLGSLENLEMITLQNNNITDEMPEQVCDLREKKTLEVLTADCATPPNPPKVECNCCTECF